MRHFPLCMAALVVTSTATADPLRSQATTAPQVIATGSANQALRPDRAKIRIGIEVHAPAAAEASTQLAIRIAAVTEALSQFPAPLDSVQTVSFNVGPNYDYEAGKKLVDYEAHAVLQVSIRALDLLGRLVDAALGAGATDIDRMTFESDSAEVVRRVLLAEAFASARTDAAALAAASGGRLGPVLLISTVVPDEFRISAAFSAQSGILSAPGSSDVIVAVNVYTCWRLLPSTR